MIDNRGTLDGLFAAGKIRVERGELFATTPPPLPPGFDFGRVEGMLLGLAIGDGLGNTTEGQLPARRRAERGVIMDYLPNRNAAWRQVGLPSDDAQLAFWTLEQLNVDGGLIPDNLAQRFCREPIFGIGSAVGAFVRAYRAGVAWDAAGPEQAGNGALMRIAPILLPHLRRPTAALWADTALCAMLTHNDRASIAACLALVRLLWEALRLEAPPPPEWWLQTFCATMLPLEGATHYAPRGPASAYDGPMAAFAAEVVPRALAQGLSVEDACNRWYSGAYLLETIPSVLYILCRHAGDPEAAIVSAVNDTKDNDTVAAIVGAVVGALHGKEALPRRWRDGLLGRTGAADDGRVFALISEAKPRWWGA